MGKTIAFLNEKGGTGKTSCCFNTAWYFSTAEKRVLLVDFDGQNANLSYMAGVNKQDVKTLREIVDGTPTREAILNLKENLDIIPAATRVTNISSEAKILTLKRALAEVKDEYDYIFIDASPSPDWKHALILVASDYVIIPNLPDVMSLEADNGIIDSIKEIQESANPNLRVLGIVINSNEERSNLSAESKKVAELLTKKVNSSLFDTKIRRSSKMGETVAAHVGITDYAPNTKVATDIIFFAEEIERRIADGEV